MRNRLWQRGSSLSWPAGVLMIMCAALSARAGGPFLPEDLGLRTMLRDTPAAVGIREQLLNAGYFNADNMQYVVSIGQGTSTAAPPVVEDLSLLEMTVNLQEMSIRDGTVSDLSPISQLVRLWSVDLGNNAIVDLTPLAGLHKLEILVLEHNQIVDLTPLAGLTNLWRLYLADNEIQDLSPLANLTGLARLDLHGNAALSDLSALASLHDLTYLDLSKTDVRDLAPLTSLRNLRRLFLENTLLATQALQEQLPLIQANNPGIEIRYSPYEPSPWPWLEGYDQVISFDWLPTLMGIAAGDDPADYVTVASPRSAPAVEPARLELAGVLALEEEVH